MEAAVLHCKFMVDVLQDEANRKRSLLESGECDDGNMHLIRQEMGKVLKSLLALHHLLQRALAGYHVSLTSTDNIASTTEQQHSTKLSQALQKWLSNPVSQQAVPAASLSVTAQQAADKLLHARQAQLAAELESINESPSVPGPSIEVIRGVVQYLRAAEQSVDFQAALAHQMQQAADLEECSLENFAYGSTSYPSWLTVVTNDQVLPAINAAMGRQSQHMVWGSSSGWLVFYGALTFGWASHGYEILPNLVDTAEACARVHNLEAVARFTTGDLLSSCLDNVGFLQLTDQCWDQQLIALARAKVERELPDGAVCLDYTGSLKRVAALQLLAVITTAVSWNAKQKLHVYVCKRQ